MIPETNLEETPMTDETIDTSTEAQPAEAPKFHDRVKHLVEEIESIFGYDTGLAHTVVYQAVQAGKIAPLNGPLTAGVSVSNHVQENLVKTAPVQPLANGINAPKDDEGKKATDASPEEFKAQTGLPLVNSETGEPEAAAETKTEGNSETPYGVAPDGHALSEAEAEEATRPAEETTDLTHPVEPAHEEI